MHEDAEGGMGMHEGAPGWMDARGGTRVHRDYKDAQSCTRMHKGAVDTMGTDAR